jgi:2-polyprenyl-6-methoxyphenol hydroxylase-like FAD-dependent oxidoreductase
VTAGADVVVRGAGPVGCTLALALRGSRHAVRVVDPQPSPPGAFRPIALSHASRLILERIGVWGEFAVTPILGIRVSQAGAFGRTRMDAADAGVPALGYVTQYAELLAALRARLGNVLAHPARAVRAVLRRAGVPGEAGQSRYLRADVERLFDRHGLTVVADVPIPLDDRRDYFIFRVRKTGSGTA